LGIVGDSGREQVNAWLGEGPGCRIGREEIHAPLVHVAGGNLSRRTPVLRPVWW
jgi:hypothetical protein